MKSETLEKLEAIKKLANIGSNLPTKANFKRISFLLNEIIQDEKGNKKSKTEIIRNAFSEFAFTYVGEELINYIDEAVTKHLHDYSWKIKGVKAIRTSTMLGLKESKILFETIVMRTLDFNSLK